MLNRGAFTLASKQPVVDWLDTAFPIPRERAATLVEANQELTVYLVSDATVESPGCLSALAETQLQSVVRDRTRRLVHRPGSLGRRIRPTPCSNLGSRPSCTTVVVDLVGTPIHDDDF
jgi:hypothetical protein